MILDRQTRLATAQAFTATGGTTDYYDASKPRHLGSGEPLAMVFTVTTSADFTTGDENYTFAIQTDDNTSFSSPTAVVSRFVSAANGALAAGRQVVVPLPPNVGEQYWRGHLTLAGTTPSISVTVDMVPFNAASSWLANPDNITIL